jgi:anaerobic selenocysteine-containing dehydrogenase
MTQIIETNVDQTPDDKRNFIKGAAIAAGALAVGLGASNSQARTLDVLALKEPTLKRNLSVSFGSTKFTRVDLDKAIDQILNYTGCPNCGLNGFDIRFGVNEVLPVETTVPTTATLF